MYWFSLIKSIIFSLDFRFVERLYKLIHIQKFVNIIEYQIINKRQELEKEFKLKTANTYDKKRSILIKECYNIIDEFLPRFFRNPIILVLWSILETVLSEIANYLKDKNNV